MSWNDGIDPLNCFSLTDFHDFDFCQFRFFVKHHLKKKYEIEDSNYNMALGTVLDQAIKIFHDTKSYGQPPTYLSKVVLAANNFIKSKVNTYSGPSFYSAIIPFLTPELLTQASQVFERYYKALDCQIKPSLGSVGFCECILKTAHGDCKLWGGPDAYEMGDDGIPEVVDYKYREPGDKAKKYMDMDLMPKIYTLLAARFLIGKGHKKARFVVRLWQDPGDDSLAEMFNLEDLLSCEDVFRKRLEKILQTKDLTFCEKQFCSACQSQKRQEYLDSLSNRHKIIVLIKTSSSEDGYSDLPF